MSNNNLIGNNGRPTFGIYDEPLSDLGLEKMRLYGKPHHNNIQRKFVLSCRIKRWEYIGVCNDEIIFGATVINLGYMSAMFAYVFDRERRSLKKYDAALPGPSSANFNDSSRNGIVSFRHGGDRIIFTHNENNRIIDVALGNSFFATLEMKNASMPLIFLGRVGLQGFNYTHKEAGIPMSGSVRIGTKEWNVAADNSFGVMDYTVGYLSRSTFWNWASGGGADTNGNRLGFNLVQGVNETGYTENAIWINDKLIKVDVVNFAYNDMDIIKPWKISSYDGRVNLTFVPEGERGDNKNFGVVVSRFHQLFGSFHGEISDGANKYILDKVFGFAEEHFAKW